MLFHNQKRCQYISIVNIIVNAFPIITIIKKLLSVILFVLFSIVILSQHFSCLKWISFISFSAYLWLFFIIFLMIFLLIFLLFFLLSYSVSNIFLLNFVNAFFLVTVSKKSRSCLLWSTTWCKTCELWWCARSLPSSAQNVKPCCERFVYESDNLGNNINILLI